MRTRAALHIMMIAMGAVVVSVASICPADERTDKLVEQLTAQAKTNPERVALLSKAADAARDDVTKAALLEKTVEYGLKALGDANTRPLVEKALEILPRISPDKVDVYHTQQVELYRAWQASAKPEEKADISYKYASALIAVARGHEDERRWKEARSAYQTAASTAQSLKLTQLAQEAGDGANRAAEMDAARQKADGLIKTLEKNPDDAKTRLELVETLVVALDEPNEAARHINGDLPEAWRTYVPLAAETGDANDRGVCKEVGDWYYKVLEPKAQRFAKLNMESRAEAWYQRVLACGKEDDLTLVTRVALDKIEEAQANRSGTPKDYIVNFIAKRDALPPAKQADLIKQALSDLSRGAVVKVQYKADTTGKKIISLSVEGPDLLTLEPLAGLPLEELTVGETYGGVLCPKIRDLRGLRGLPLKSLSLGTPAVRNLRGLKGLKLESLTLFGWKDLTSPEGLEGMPLKSLDLRCDNLKTLLPLKGLPLEKLAVNSRKLDSLKGLEDSPLVSLKLEWSSFTSLEGLNAKKLTTLHLGACGIKSLAGLEGSPLTELCMRYGHVTDLAPLKGNTTLTKLEIGYCPMTSLEGVESMPLTNVDIVGCGLSAAELERLKKIPTLKHVEH